MSKAFDKAKELASMVHGSPITAPPEGYADKLRMLRGKFEDGTEYIVLVGIGSTVTADLTTFLERLDATGNMIIVKPQ